MSDDEPILLRGVWHSRISLRVENHTIAAGTHTMLGVDGVGPSADPPISEASESRVVEWCLANEMARGRLLGEIRLPFDVNVFTEVTEPIVRRSVAKPGDIDAICLSHDVSRAVALEAKCVKVRLTPDGAYDSNRFGKLRGAVDQANAVHRVGFHQAWLWILLLVDGSQGHARNVFHRRSDPAFGEVLGRVREWRLHHEVGLVISECIQPTPSSLNETGAFLTAVIDRPGERRQPTVLCEQLEQLRLTRAPLPVGMMDLDHRR